MKVTRTVFAALAALLLLPAAALAQAGPGDRYQDPIVLGSQNSPLPISPAVLGYNADTSSYTTQDGDPIFGGGPEFNQCGNSAYGKTVWGIFYTNRTGRVDITAAGFDAVIGLASFKNPQDATPAGGPCVDRLSGKIESFPRDNLPTVQKGGWYAIQVGGALDPSSGQFVGGPLEVNVELLPPEQLIADAGLTWKSTSGGVKVTQVRVDGPRDSVAAIGCIRKKCGKDVTVRNPKLKGVFARTVAKQNPLSTGRKLKPAKRSDAPIRMATKNVFKGRKIPNGGRLAVIVISRFDDQIGQIFYWDVKKNAAGPKNIGCVEPGSGKVKKLGACNGT
jgi:hypothetical protein